jgi:hypothetical protein
MSPIEKVLSGLEKVKSTESRKWQSQIPASVKVDVASSILQAAIRSCRCGLRSTAPIGVQLRVLPDQRSGFLALAAS